MLPLFAVGGAFAPASVSPTPAELHCAGYLTLPNGVRRKVVVTMWRRELGSGRMFATKRFFYGCSPERLIDDGEAFYEEIRDAALDVLARVARREARIVPLWKRAAAAATAPGARIEIAEGAMGMPIAPSVVDAGAAVRDAVLDVTFHLRSSCLQRCAFCRSEPMLQDVGVQDADLATVREFVRTVVGPASRRGVDSRFHLEADDLAGHERLDEIVSLLAPWTAFGFNMVVPPNRMAHAGIARRITALPGLDTLTMTILGGTTATHDAIAGRPGALRELIAAARNIHAAGTVPLTLSAVLTSAGAAELGKILDAVEYLRGRLIVSALFADSHAHHDWIRSIVPSLDALRAAFNREEGRLLAMKARFQDFPVCALPEALRRFNEPHFGMLRHDYPELPICRSCVHRTRCRGVPRGYLDVHGAGGFRPETRPPEAR